MTQAKALEILKIGTNVFLTGQPGSGKSYTIRTFTDWCYENNLDVAITATTGIASTHIGGVTIHSWAGIGIQTNFTDDAIEAIADKPWIKNKIYRTKVLIIDEISMLTAQTLDNVDRICRAVKDPKLPFGGIQVVLVGDFFQLPPVVKSSQKENESKFVFKSDAWKSLNLKICYLTEQHRQDDMIFLDVLTAMRNGEMGPKHMEILEGRLCSKPKCDHSKSKSTRLFTHNGDVDALNSTELHKLPGEMKSFGMEWDGVDAVVAFLKKNCLSPEILKLKIGSIVMFTRNNWDQGYVNGTLGEVVAWTEKGRPIVRTKDGMEIEPEYEEWAVTEYNKKIASIRQIPLRLAWAITVHKSQGMSLDSAIIDLSGAFEYGQGYVALSRVRSLEGLYLLGLNEKTFHMHPEVVEIDKQFLIESEKLT